VFILQNWLHVREQLKDGNYTRNCYTPFFTQPCNDWTRFWGSVNTSLKPKLMERGTLNDDDSGNCVPPSFTVKQHVRYHNSALRVLTTAAPDVFLKVTSWLFIAVIARLLQKFYLHYSGARGKNIKLQPLLFHSSYFGKNINMYVKRNK
jgi:hypothetical protein